MDTCIQEAEERRRGDQAILERLGRVEDRVSELVLVSAKNTKETRMLRRRARKDVAGLQDEMAKLNRRALAIALAAVLAALGSIPEARALAGVIVKGLMSH